MPNIPHICVCICTFKRPDLLSRLLSRLETQETDGLFEYSIIVVDNDRFRSARDTVGAYADQSRMEMRYYVEPEQNIALARNKAVENARGNLIAFIDDDEFPDNHWLLNLYQTMQRYGPDGVLGPVLPYFEAEPPEWVRRGRFFERTNHQTGHILGWRNTRTGNTLLRKDLFNENQQWFDPAFGSGGEDRDFFKRKIEDGHSFVWCNEAQVYEIVTSKRWQRKVLLKRALLRGKMALGSAQSRRRSVFVSLVAVAFYTACLPLFLVAGQHVFMKYLIKDCDHLGKVLSFLGIDLVREKYVGV